VRKEPELPVKKEELVAPLVSVQLGIENSIHKSM
jgi:hypothetical protein